MKIGLEHVPELLGHSCQTTLLGLYLSITNSILICQEHGPYTMGLHLRQTKC